MDVRNVNIDAKPTLNLYIPEECKPRILDLAREVHLENITNERKRDTIKRVSKQTMEKIGFTFPKDFASEWEKCLKVAESTRPHSVYGFIDALAKAAAKLVKVDCPWDWRAPEMLRRLSFAIYTALIKSLFIQFDSEKDLFECTLRLHMAVRYSSDVNWKEIDKSRFIPRLTQEWAAFRPLMVDAVDMKDYHLSTSFLLSIGLEVSDFINSYFSCHDLSPDEPGVLCQDVLTEIAVLLNDDLPAFRQVCRAFYNAVEINEKSRLKHRLFLISKDIILKELIGKVFYHGNGYLLSNPVGNINNNYAYRVTSMQSPYQSFTFCGAQNQFSKMIGGYICKDATGKLIVLTAYVAVGDGEFWVQQLKLNSLQALTERVYTKKIIVTHDPKLVSDCYNRPIWEREAVISENAGKVSIDVKFTEKKVSRISPLTYGFFGAVERYRAEFSLSDFESTSETVVQARKVVNNL